MLVENKTGKIYFQGQKMAVLIQNNYQQARDSQHLKLMYCVSISFRDFFQNAKIAKISTHGN